MGGMACIALKLNNKPILRDLRMQRFFSLLPQKAIMKKLVSIILSCSPLLVIAQQHQLEKLWETDTIVAVPESVLPDFKQGILYISLIDGGGWDADGKGGVA